MYIVLFLFDCARSWLLCAGFLYLPRVGAALRFNARASHCSDSSCCGARLLGLQYSWCTGLVVVACGPHRTQASVVAARGLGGCGSRAYLHVESSCCC